MFLASDQSVCKPAARIDLLLDESDIASPSSFPQWDANLVKYRQTPM